MQKRYIFFKGIIHTLDLYTDEFVEIYIQQGGECLVLDAGRMEEEMLRLKAFLLEPVTAAVSFNNIGLHLEFEDGKNIWDCYQVPFFNIMMDHPFHYKKALDTAPEQMALLCMDKNHVEYVRRFFPHIQRVEFFPHAGIELDRTAGQRMPAPRTGREGETAAAEICGNGKLQIRERKIDVLYAGGLSRYAAEGLIPDLGKIVDFDAFELVKNALERLILEPDNTTEYVIEHCLGDMNLRFNNKRLGGIIADLRFVDSFAVSFYREKMIRVLVENGITVTVFGAGWDRCEWEHPNLVYGGEIPPIGILELMGQSKIVLNTMTWFKRGAHDRIFNGMLAGAAVVSDTSEYMQEHFTAGRELQLFSLKDMGNLVGIVKSLLEHPEEAQQLADCGHRVALGHHMWKNRMRDVRIL